MVVRTKMDQFHDTQFGKAYSKFSNDITALHKHCEEELLQRMDVIEQEISEIPYGRFNAIVAVSKGRSENHMISRKRLNIFSRRRSRVYSNSYQRNSPLFQS